MKETFKNYAILINPNKQYLVDYVILQDGTKVFKPTMLKGSDLTEKQIIDLLKFNV